MPGLNYLGGGPSGAPQMPGTAPGQPPALGPSGPVPPGPLGAPLAGLLPPGGGSPMPDYQAVTQTDGTVVLHIKLPNGELGPAVKIITPPRPKQAASNG